MGIVHIPDPERIRSAGFADCADVPVIFLTGYRYAHELNWYLRDRARLKWHPSKLPAEMHEVFGRIVRIPKASSLVTMARQLLDFWEWTEWAGVDWTKAEYASELIQGYQADMSAGRWSASRSALAPNTINQRVMGACHFLFWAGMQGLRPPFRMLLTRNNVSHNNSFRDGMGRRFRPKYSRIGAVRQNPSDLRLPTASEVAIWLRRVEARFGQTKALMCRTVLETATRRQETVQWRCSYLGEDRSKWRVVGEKVRTTLIHGTKGDKARDIGIPVDFALELHRFAQFGRLKAGAKWADRHKNSPLPAQLFLSEYDGEPISYQVFYEAWVGVQELPFKGWSPHLGRHYWACITLLRQLMREATLASATLGGMPNAWVDNVGRNVIDTVIRPQLGHCDVETTEKYLRWIETATALTDQYLDFHRFLDGGCPETSFARRY